jgi:hypothetical protein
MTNALHGVGTTQTFHWRARGSGKLPTRFFDTTTGVSSGVSTLSVFAHGLIGRQFWNAFAIHFGIAILGIGVKLQENKER